MFLRKSNAFTLVELLVAMTIGVIIMAACYASLKTVLKASDGVSGRCALYQQGRRALDELTWAMRSAVVVGGRGTQFLGEDRREGEFHDDRVTFYTVSDRRARRDRAENALLVAERARGLE